MNYVPLCVAALIACAALQHASAIEHKSDAGPEAGLASVRRVYVEPLGGGQSSEQMRDMIIAALQNSGLFVVTENQERADAILKGSADDRIYTEYHQTSESVGLRASAGNSSGSGSGGSRVSDRASASAGVSENESMRVQERKHEATAALRLVDPDGDVMWSTTQESTGGKFRGAMADLADRIARQLVTDTKKARTRVALPPAPATRTGN